MEFVVSNERKTDDNNIVYDLEVGGEIKWNGWSIISIDSYCRVQDVMKEGDVYFGPGAESGLTGNELRQIYEDLDKRKRNIGRGIEGE